VLPDESRTLVLKTLAWRARMQAKDAVDLWRCLEICFVAGAKPSDFSQDIAARTTLLQAFSRLKGHAMQQITDSGKLSTQAATKRWTRIRALVANLLE
jgi:hypothetical protein